MRVDYSSEQIAVGQGRLSGARDATSAPAAFLSAFRNSEVAPGTRQERGERANRDVPQQADASDANTPARPPEADVGRRVDRPPRGGTGSTASASHGAKTVDGAPNSETAPQGDHPGAGGPGPEETGHDRRVSGSAEQAEPSGTRKTLTDDVGAAFLANVSGLPSAQNVVSPSGATGNAVDWNVGQTMAQARSKHSLETMASSVLPRPAPTNAPAARDATPLVGLLPSTGWRDPSIMADMSRGNPLTAAGPIAPVSARAAGGALWSLNGSGLADHSEGVRAMSERHPGASHAGRVNPGLTPQWQQAWPDTGAGTTVALGLNSRTADIGSNPVGLVSDNAVFGGTTPRADVVRNMSGDTTTHSPSRDSSGRVGPWSGDSATSTTIQGASASPAPSLLRQGSEMSSPLAAPSPGAHAPVRAGVSAVNSGGGGPSSSVGKGETRPALPERGAVFNGLAADTLRSAEPAAFAAHGSPNVASTQGRRPGIFGTPATALATAPASADQPRTRDAPDHAPVSRAGGPGPATGTRAQAPIGTLDPSTAGAAVVVGAGDSAAPVDMPDGLARNGGDTMRPDPSGPVAPDARGAQARAESIVRQIIPELRVLADGAAEVRLAPEDLGRIRLTMHADGGGMVVQVSAERTDTLDLLRRHSDLLGNALRDAGFGTVEYSFSDGRRQPDMPGRAMPDDRFAAVNTADAEDPATPSVAADRLDLRI